jgi:pimeloyl-ACP methyl ester carboxylesterase
VSEGLLLLHGWPLDARMWEPQVVAFGDRTTVVAPHLPGFGGTPDAGPVMTMGAAADRAREALDAAGVERAVVCGISMGGYVAFELWRQAGHRFAGLVLANTRSGADNDEGRAKRTALAERLRAEGNGFFLESPPALLSEGAAPDLRERVMGIVADQPAGSIAAASLGMAERPDSTPDLASIDVPTAVLTSSADALIPQEMSTPLASAIPGAELTVLEGAGHMSGLEDPDGFNRAVARTLDRSFRGA